MTTPEKATEKRIRELIETPNGVLFTIHGAFDVYAADFFRDKESHSVSFFTPFLISNAYFEMRFINKSS